MQNPARAKPKKNPRKLVLTAMERVVAGGRLDTTLAAIDQAGLSVRDRAFARLLLLQGLRFFHGLGRELSKLCPRRPPRREGNVLILAAVQWLILKHPAHAVVAEQVRLVRPETRGFVNAVLRRMVREWSDCPADVRSRVIAANAPDDWLERLGRHWGNERARRILDAQATIPPLDLAFVDQAAVCAFREALPSGVAPLTTVTDGLRLSEGNPTKLPFYQDGRWWVQDIAAQLPVWLLRREVRGRRVLDLCAAPGGKSAQLLACGANLTAIDADPERMARLQQNMARLGFSPETITIRAEDWQAPEPFDCVFLDAPCSASGTVRRHPDVLFRKPRDLASQQQTLFAKAVDFLKPGGIVVYSVCSLDRAEGCDLADTMTQKLPLTPFPFHPDDRLTLQTVVENPLSGDHLLQTLPDDWASGGGMDGFFLAAYRKNT